MHAGGQAGIGLTYGVLQRLDLKFLVCGGSDALSVTGLGEIPLDKEGTWCLSTRSPAAMIANNTVLTGSCSLTTDTTPASQASAINRGFLCVIRTIRSGLESGNGSCSSAA